MSQTVTVLVSTMEDNILLNKGLLHLDEPKAKCLIIQQVASKANAPSLDEPESTMVHTFQERGIAKSRNRGLAACDTEFAVLADDDVIYKPGFAQALIKAFQETDADVLTFAIETPEGQPFKRYAKTSFRHHFRSILRVASISIAVRMSSVRKANLHFDERFGLGSGRYASGEENIFLADALNSGLKVVYVPQFWVIHPKESSGQNFDDVQWVTKGAMLARMYGWSGFFIIPIFAFAKRSLAQNKSYAQILRLMKTGFREIRKG